MPRRRTKKNTSAKGALYQRYAKQLLEAQGYEVEVCRAKIVWLGPGRPISVGTDFWGRIDLIAVHPTARPKLIQVSVPSELSRKRRNLSGWTPAGCDVEVWLYHGGRGRHFRCYAAPFQTVLHALPIRHQRRHLPEQRLATGRSGVPV